MDPVAQALFDTFSVGVFPSRRWPAAVHRRNTVINTEKELIEISNASYEFITLLLTKGSNFEFGGISEFKPFTHFMDNYGEYLHKKNLQQDMHLDIASHDALAHLKSGVYTLYFQQNAEVLRTAKSLSRLIRLMRGRCYATVYVWQPQISAASVGHAALEIMVPSRAATYISFWPLRNENLIILAKKAVFSGPSLYVPAYAADCSAKFMNRSADDIILLENLDSIDMLSYWEQIKRSFKKYQVIKSNCSSIVARILMCGWSYAKDNIRSM